MPAFTPRAARRTCARTSRLCPTRSRSRAWSGKSGKPTAVVVGRRLGGCLPPGGGDFYYADNASYRKIFRENTRRKYHFKGAFDGMMHHWGHAGRILGDTSPPFSIRRRRRPLRAPLYRFAGAPAGEGFLYPDHKNQDTQFVKTVPRREKWRKSQGDHRFFQCAACCTDDTWGRRYSRSREMGAGHGARARAVPAGMNSPRCPALRRGRAFPVGAGIRELFCRAKKIRGAIREDFPAMCCRTKRKKVLFFRIGRRPP